MTDAAINAIEVFYSYAHKDEALRETLEKHLSSLRHQGLIQEWHDRRIVAGADWRHSINIHLQSASVILLLISPDFMASDYCLGIEMQQAMQRHNAREAYIIPILLSPVDWTSAPFADLQMLPSGTRAVTTWDNQDEAFLDVTRGIRHVIENLHLYLQSIAEKVDPTRLPGDTTSYFMSLESYLKPSQLRFPTTNDFEQDLVYLPELYIPEIKAALHEKRRVLLTGPAAAGKTVLALAFAKELAETENYRISYKDVGRAKAGEGHKWHRLMHAHDRKSVLYILDNCHLAPEEINEFCLQWEESPPQHAQCILISRAYAGEPEAPSRSIYHYFEACTDETLKIRPEKVYWGMLQKYAASYWRRNPGHYVQLKEDSAELLKKQHAHNLVISRSRLEAWRNLGGRLSDVRQEAVHLTLIERYLSSGGEALPFLCALRQYEVSVHNYFVETKLPREEIRQLQQEKLLTNATVQNYGMLYDLVFHSAEAREIFEANIYRQRGRITWKLIKNELIKAFQAYLRTAPPNYIAIYESLTRQKQKRILERLLWDRQLQECAAEQFEAGNISDALHYLFKLAKADAARAHELLDALAEEIGIQELHIRIARHSFQDMTFMLVSLQQIDAKVAKNVVALLDVIQIPQRLGEQNVQSLFSLVRTLQGISLPQANTLLLSIPIEALVAHTTINNVVPIVEKLRRCGYPPARLRAFAKALDSQQLARQWEDEENMTRGGLQRLCKVLRSLKDIAPGQASMLLEQVSLNILTAGARANMLNSVGQLVDCMHSCGATSGYVERFIEAIGTSQIVEKAERENLQHLYFFVRSLRRASPTSASKLLETLTPKRLALLCRAKEVPIAMIDQFHKVVDKEYWQRFLRQFSIKEMAGIFHHSPLGSIGSFLKPRYFYFRLSYQLFREQFLEERLKTEPLDEIGKFLARIKQVPEVGDELASRVLDLLIQVDLSERIAGKDLLPFALLLHTITSVYTGQMGHWLAPLGQPEVVLTAIEASSPGSIQALIHNVARIDNTVEKRYLKAIGEGLQTSSRPIERCATADLSAIAALLWNIYVSVDSGLAQEYCMFVDGQQREQQLATAPLEELCAFLWKLTAIINPLRLSIMDEPVIGERLIKAWNKETGQGAQLFGILMVAQRNVQDSQLQALLPTELTHSQKEHVVWWLMEAIKRKDVYTLALTLYGLRAYNETEARALAGQIVTRQLVEQLQTEEREAASSPCSIMLLRDVSKWLEEMADG